MFELIEISEVKDDDILIDLRSEGEFSEFHIPNSISFPILNNEQRKIVGTLYANDKIREAKVEAIRFAKDKLLDLEELLDNNGDSRIIVYCQRGGYRSKSVASLFYSLGYNVYKLVGGIKAYRQKINEELQERIREIDLIVLYGATGSGKTDILKKLEATGFPVLDLEGMANHMGSVLGSVGQGEPNTQKMFEALLYEKLKKSDSRLFFTEGESKRIGKIMQPDALYEKLKVGTSVYIKTCLQDRVDRLVEVYARTGTYGELEEALHKLSRYMSKGLYADIIKKLENKDYRAIAEILCKEYYDKNYKMKEEDTDYILENENLDVSVNKLSELYKVIEK